MTVAEFITKWCSPGPEEHYMRADLEALLKESEDIGVDIGFALAREGTRCDIALHQP